LVTHRTVARAVLYRDVVLMRKAPAGPDYEWFGSSWTTRPADREIRGLLVDRLRENPLTRREEFRVAVERGEVTLSGAVSSPTARRAADDDSWATPGVVDVHNHLGVAIRPVRGEGPRAA
jgi:BON domain-containing protein